MMAFKQKENRLVVTGEDEESEDELEEISSKNVKGQNQKGNGVGVTDTSKNNRPTTIPVVKVVTYGEAPESDGEAEYEDFGSTVSLASSANSSLEEPGLLKLDEETAAVLAPILPQRRMPSLDAAMIKKHRDRNISLRTNIVEKFLFPVIMQSAKKFERLSQNLSNSQMLMQEALFQSRIATGNLLKLQKELETFLEEDYLKELKILPTDQSPSDNNAEEFYKDDQSVQDLQNNENSSSSLLTAALAGGAHII